MNLEQIKNLTREIIKPDTPEKQVKEKLDKILNFKPETYEVNQFQKLLDLIANKITTNGHWSPQIELDFENKAIQNQSKSSNDNYLADVTNLVLAINLEPNNITCHREAFDKIVQILNASDPLSKPDPKISAALITLNDVAKRIGKPPLLNENKQLQMIRTLDNKKKMPDTLSIGLIFEHKDFLSMEWLNTQYKNQYTNLNHEDCLALLNKYLTFSHLQLCDFERLFWLCKTIEDSLGQEHPSLIDIIFSISRQGLEYINLNARKQLVLNGGNRIKINTKLFNQYCQWILEKLHPRNDVYHVYILVISIYNFIAIAPDDKQILEDIIDRLLEKNNLTPPLIKSVASTLLTHQKILCDPFHKLINIYLRDKDSAISNWLIHEIIASP